MSHVLIIEDERRAADQLKERIQSVLGTEIRTIDIASTYEQACSMLSQKRKRYGYVFCDLLLLPHYLVLGHSMLKDTSDNDSVVQFSPAHWQKYVVEEGGVSIIRYIREGIFHAVKSDVPIVATSFFDSFPGYFRLLRMIGHGHDQHLIVLPKVVSNPLYLDGTEFKNIQRELGKFIQSLVVADSKQCVRIAARIRGDLFQRRKNAAFKQVEEAINTKSAESILQQYKRLALTTTLYVEFDPTKSKTLELQLFDWASNPYPFASMYEDWINLRNSILLDPRIRLGMSIQPKNLDNPERAIDKVDLPELFIDAGLPEKERVRRVLLRCLLVYLALVSEPLQATEKEGLFGRGWLVSKSVWQTQALDKLEEIPDKTWADLNINDLSSFHLAANSNLNIPELVKELRQILDNPDISAIDIVVGEAQSGYYFNGDIELLYKGQDKIIKQRAPLPNHKKVLFLPLKDNFSFDCRPIVKQISKNELSAILCDNGYEVITVKSRKELADKTNDPDICLVGPVDRSALDEWTSLCQQGDDSVTKIKEKGTLVVLMTTFSDLLSPEERDMLESFRIYLMMPKADSNAISDIKLLDTLLCAHDRTKYMSCQLETRGLMALWSDISKEYLREFNLAHKKIGRAGGIPDSFSGSASMRHGEFMIITSTRTNKLKITVEDIAIVKDFDPVSFRVEWIGKRRPSSSTPWHWFIYKHFDNVNAILHTHWKKLTYSPSLSDYRTRLYVPYGTSNLGAEVVQTLERQGNQNFAIIREHGEFALGSTLSDAAKRLIAIEKAIREVGGEIACASRTTRYEGHSPEI